MGRFSGRTTIPPSKIRGGLITGSWGRFLDGGGEAGSSRVVVALGSIPCAITLLIFATSNCVIQGGKIVGRRAAFRGMTALIVYVGTNHRVRNTIEVDICG